MAQKLSKLECDPKCGFSIQGHDEKEIIEIAIEHAKKAHSMAVTEKQAREMLQEV